ncbi:MAG: hypothetical protein GY867_00005, partial [bacterium]|nr:hypothetical protein [bacterium]
MTSKLVRQSLVAASVVTIGANIVGRLLGYVREATIADFFGTTSVFDTFILAFTIPEIITFIVFAALPTAIVPATKAVAGDSTAAEKQLFLQGLGAFGAIFGLLALLTYLLRYEILGFLAPDLPPEQAAAGVQLMAVLAGFVFFRGVEAYFRGWLYKKKHFVAPALSPFLLNVVVLGAITLLHDSHGIYALAYGWLGGSAILFILNGFLVCALIRPWGSKGGLNVSIAPVMKLAGGVILLESLTLLHPVVDRFLAARYLGEGQIAALRYAIFLAMLAPGMLVVTFSIASFPWLADLSDPAKREELRKRYHDSMRLIIFAIGLVAAGMLFFARDIVQVAFMRGAFDQVSVDLTTSPFIIYTAGILLYSVYHFQTRLYYARRAVLRLGTVLVSVFIIKIILSALLVGPMEHDGLALATAIAWTIGAAI